MANHTITNSILHFEDVPEFENELIDFEFELSRAFHNFVYLPIFENNINTESGIWKAGKRKFYNSLNIIKDKMASFFSRIICNRTATTSLLCKFSLLIHYYLYYKSRIHKLSGRFKLKYFKKQCSSSSFLLTWSRYTCPKLLWSTQQASFMSKMHSTSLLSTPWSF